MNPFEIEQKIKQLTRRVCCAINQIESGISEACVDEGSVPHTSVTFGESGGELALTFSGGSGETLVTNIVVFRNGVLVVSDSMASPDTVYVVSGESPASVCEEIYVLYRAGCETPSVEGDIGTGNWRIGYYIDTNCE